MKFEKFQSVFNYLQRSLKRKEVETSLAIKKLMRLRDVYYCKRDENYDKNRELRKRISKMDNCVESVKMIVERL